MSLPHNSEPDPIDALAGVAGQCTGDDELRQSVLACTVGVIRRRRRLKRISLVTTLFGCYLAGIGTVLLLSPDGGSPSASLDGKNNGPKHEVLPVNSMDEIGRRSVAKNQSRFEVLRQKGDRCLRQKRDLALALRHYDRALGYASAEERAISAEDDGWLLMALKESQIQETRNEDDDG